MRQISAEGGFAAILAKGDPDSGTYILLLRDEHFIHTKVLHSCRIVTLFCQLHPIPKQICKASGTLSML